MATGQVAASDHHLTEATRYLESAAEKRGTSSEHITDLMYAAVHALIGVGRAIEYGHAPGPTW
jgi:hypothetical protein